MLHRDEIIRRIVEMLDKTGYRELRIVLAFVRELTRE